jgi:hypothetical protein
MLAWDMILVGTILRIKEMRDLPNNVSLKTLFFQHNTFHEMGRVLSFLLQAKQTEGTAKTLEIFPYTVITY